MIFHGYFRSSAAWRCRIAFNLKGVEPEMRYVHLRKGEQRDPGFLARNPQGLLPALELDGGAVLTQSLAIIEWLDEAHPDPALLPADQVLKAQVRAFALAIACDIHPLQNLRVLQHLRTHYAQDQGGVDAWCQRWLGEGLAACETLAAAHAGKGDFCFGETPGLADVCLVPQLASADRFGVGLDAMPRLRAVREACERLPAFRDAAAGRQPDAES
jgi:maleylacetoacetate isomerase